LFPLKKPSQKTMKARQHSEVALPKTS
jgi:hypothetical protein